MRTALEGDLGRKVIKAEEEKEIKKRRKADHQMLVHN
jgi:hypothetical protein